MNKAEGGKYSPGTRDINAEAQQWRANVRHPILAKQIAELGADALIHAYEVWWQAYTRSVQSAPSNRLGISTADAAEAGETANRSVRELLKREKESA